MSGIIVCSVYDAAIKAETRPHVVLDMTMSGVPSETAKSVTAALALPTISTSFGQEGDLRWDLFLTPKKERGKQNSVRTSGDLQLSNHRHTFIWETLFALVCTQLNSKNWHVFQIRNLRYRQWRSLDEAEKNYLIQIMPPADIMPEIIRRIVIFQNITNAGILFDDSIGKIICDECTITTVIRRSLYDAHEINT